MTLPTPDAQSPRLLSDHPHSTPVVPSGSTPVPASPGYPTPSSILSSSLPSTGRSGDVAGDDTDFAVSSWDLATGGLKALTAKREVPPFLERRPNPSGQLPALQAASRRYTFALVILVCIVVMLISGGVVLFLLLQP